ncbi:MAG: hypothetical protein IKP26_08905 [Clostridia bacterium]|nr:hypothetical protein [Clostridia bacterium]
MNLTRRFLVALLAAAVLLSALPALSMSVSDYNAHDVEKLRAFFSQEGGSGYTNGRVINGSTFDIDDPSTWKKCTWNAEGRLESLAFDNLGWNVAGALDLSGCTGLVSLTGRDCELSSVDVSDCTQLRSLYVTGNLIAGLSIENTPSLNVLWVDHNLLTELDVSANPLLSSLDCSYNSIALLDVTSCPALTVLRCSNNPIAALDVSNCPLITEFSCKSTEISELDISNLTSLRAFYCFNTKLTRLEASVFNGGESFVIEAVGPGYIGFRTYLGSSVTYKASSLAQEGFSFAGWYLDEMRVSDAADITLAFGEGEKLLRAYFYELGDVDHSLSVDSTDALLALRCALGIITQDELDPVLADFDQNGVLDSADSLLILRRALGIS